MKCTIFQEQVTDINGKTSWQPVDGDLGGQMCTDACSAQMKELSDKGELTTATCVGFGDPIQWEDFSRKSSASIPGPVLTWP